MATVFSMSEGGGPPRVDAMTTTDPLTAWRYVLGRRGEAVMQARRFVLVVEDYVGAGPRDTQSKLTTEQVGFFRHSGAYFEIETYVRQSGARRRMRPMAYQLLGRRETPSHDPDDVSALAHALSEYDKQQRS